MLDKYFTIIENQKHSIEQSRRDNFVVIVNRLIFIITASPIFYIPTKKNKMKVFFDYEKVTWLSLSSPPSPTAVVLMLLLTSII